MRIFVQFGLCCLLIGLFSCPESLGQTLTEKLLKEPSAKLLLEARERGDVVRGAILFHQGNIACAKCHRPTVEQDRIGPDLSRLAATVSNESLVESILQPSKVVAKEYQTTIVIRMDGLTSTGVVLKEDADSIVLRDAGNVEKLITISRSSIDEIVPGTKSIMPEGLADELKDKQQFLDLLRYVLDTKERGPVSEAQTSSMVKRTLSQELNGLVLLRKHNCSACHQADSQLTKLVQSKAPDLRWSAKNANPEFLARFIANPESVKAGTTMPHVMQHMDSAAKQSSAKAIVAYLTSLDGNTYLQNSTAAIEPSAASRGADIFHSVGCVACHSPRDDKGTEQSLAASIPMSQLTDKYSLSGLTRFLENPHVARPGGRMPNMQLSHREAVDIASYLMQPVGQSQQDSAKQHPVSNAVEIKMGKTLFTSLNCAACHTGIVQPDHESDHRAFTPMAKLTAGTGCLAETPGKSQPKFHLSVSERSDIAAALNSSEPDLSSNQKIDVALATFNCTACHTRDQLGGVTPERSVHFQTTNLNLGEQGRIPPTLTGVGAKLKSKWMRDVLVNGKSIRPYMKTRMPQFGEVNVGHLIELFQESDQLEDTPFAQVKDQKKTREFGLKLAGNQGLNCVACHTYQYKISDTMPAVDLTEMADRLHKDWFYQYMLAPQKFSPNTVMPSFWPNGQAIRADLEGSPEDQVEALWTYLLDGRQARAPRGVIREPLEIVVTNEARMLRRAYPEMGKRGIGVGYPGGVNLAFDAEQMRLAMIWKGRFVDPSGVWYGQGHGRVRPMGQTVSFPKGPDLDSASTPWVVDDGRPPSHQFKGYVLDKERRPTFRYTFGQVQIQDFFAEAAGSTGDKVQLKRTVKFEAAKAIAGVRFRLAANGRIEETADREFAVGDRLKIRILSDHTGNVSPDASGKQLVVPLTLTAAETQKLVVEYVWD